jgi:hypothetical protein
MGGGRLAAVAADHTVGDAVVGHERVVAGAPPNRADD